MTIQSITLKHNGKNCKVYKGQKGGMYIVRKNRKVYLQSGSGKFADLRAAAAKKFAAAKGIVKSAATAVGDVASAAAQSMPISSAVQGIKGVGSVLGSMIGGSMYLQMSEQFGGQGISARINGKYRKVFTTKTGKFYYKQQGKKVYIKQDGAGFGSLFKKIGSKAMPFIKDFAMEQGQAMLQNAVAPVVAAPVVMAPRPAPVPVIMAPVAPAPVAPAPVVMAPVAVQAGGARTVGPAYVIMQTGGSGLKVRNGRKNVRVFVTKGGRFYYKQNGKKITIQKGSGMFSKIKAAAAKVAKTAAAAAAANPVLAAAVKQAVQQQAMKTLAANPTLAAAAQQAIQVATPMLAAVPQQVVPQQVVPQVIPQPVIIQPQPQPVVVQRGGSCGKKNCPCGKNCKCGKKCKCTKTGCSCGKKKCKCGKKCKC